MTAALDFGSLDTSVTLEVDGVVYVVAREFYPDGRYVQLPNGTVIAVESFGGNELFRTIDGYHEVNQPPEGVKLYQARLAPTSKQSDPPGVLR